MPAMPEPPPDPNRYPAGWHRARAEGVIAHYDELAARGWPEGPGEEEGAADGDTHVRVTIPRDLLPAVRALLAKRAA